MKVDDFELAAAIVDEARAQNVPPDVALAFAVAESNVRNVIGDKTLFERSGYLEKVAKLHPGWETFSVARDWVSYGPYQLQALWYLRAGEAPRDLLETSLSVPRAIAVIGRLLKRYGGDADKARLAYVCGSPDNCSDEKRRRVLARYRAAEVLARDFLSTVDDEADSTPEHVYLAGALLAVAVWTLMKGRT